MIPAHVTRTSSRPRLGRRGDGSLDVGARRHVAPDGAPADPRCRLGRRRVVEVGDDDMGSLGCEALRGRRADPAGAARDERGLAGEAAHRIIRTTSSATHTGLSPPSRSTVARTTPCSPPATSSTDWTVKRPGSASPRAAEPGSARLLTP